jgi:hypothetical protein
MQVGDLVRVGAASPYMNRIGIVNNIAKRFGNIYYEVLLCGEINKISFRKNVLGVINASR